jgi:hypothetical protein
MGKVSDWKSKTEGTKMALEDVGFAVDWASVLETDDGSDSVDF